MVLVLFCELIYFTQMLIVTISRTSRHFSLVDARSRSQLHMAGAFITLIDCLVFLTKLCPFFYLEFSKCSYSRALAPGCGALVVELCPFVNCNHPDWYFKTMKVISMELGTNIRHYQRMCRDEDCKPTFFVVPASGMA